jgi:hypothetical protein
MVSFFLLRKPSGVIRNEYGFGTLTGAIHSQATGDVPAIVATTEQAQADRRRVGPDRQMVTISAAGTEQKDAAARAV